MNYIQLVENYFDSVIDNMYPIRYGNIKPTTVISPKIGITKLLNENIEKVDNIESCANDFIEKLLYIKSELNKDISSIYNGDPAATSHNEIILAYPGFYALAAYRIANYLWQLDIPYIPRIITEHAHNRTGIDIHPGANIGEGLCIDHGTGVVIGETTIIGKNVKIYQGVTLGALSITKKKTDSKRHPTIEDNVILYAQATILGGDTTIGENSIIGGNVWITNSVPANTKIYFNSKNTTITKNNKNIL